jgi:peptidoglycan/LPS O-acetylase OafA/YrhL
MSLREKPKPSLSPASAPLSILLSKLSRVTSPGRKFVPQIDGLRFVAIMAVIAYHVSMVYAFHRGLTMTRGVAAASWINTVFAAGHYGVPLFLAISGFILSLPFARQRLSGGTPVRLREYYLRRLTRIEPPYVIQLLIMFALCIILFRKLPSHPHLYNNPDWFHYTIIHILASLFYANGLIFGAHPYPNYVLWSLEVEVQFYLLAPFIAGLFLIRNKTWRRAVFFGLFVLAWLLSILAGDHYLVWASLAGNLHFFLIGFILADFYDQGQLAQGAGHLGWDIAFVLGVAIVVCANTAIAAVLLPAAVFICCIAAFRGILTVRFLGNPWITTIGGMCYTIYMYHTVLISMLIRGTEKVRTFNYSLDLLIQFILMAPAIVLICSFLFVLLERPFMVRNWPMKVRDAFRGPNTRSNRFTHTIGKAAPSRMESTGQSVESVDSAPASGPARPQD